MSRVPPDQPVRRRGLLLAGAAVGSLAACSPDPTVRGRHSGAAAATPDPTPTAPAAQLALADQEAALARLLEATAAGTRGVTAVQKKWLVGAAAQCRAHAAQLGQPDALSAPGADSSPTPSPQPTGTPASANWQAALAQIARGADQLRAGHRAAALAAEEGSLALLHASAAVAAHAIRVPGPVPTRATVRPARVEVGTLGDARLVLLSDLRALAQGLQVGIGRLPLPDERYEPGRERLTAVLAERDQVINALTAAKVDVPPAELSYAMPGGFGSPAAIVATWGRLESAVVDGWGRVAAAATGADRTAAMDQMQRHADHALSRQVALDWWPGWA